MSDEPKYADEPDNMLPPLQVPPAGDDSSDMPMPANQTVPTDSALVPVPGEAADADLIEKEWVLKAKQIVEHTASDPFRQQQELSKMKAEYLKKRYNKNLGAGQDA